MKTQLNEGEIKKWRGILFGKFGPYVFAMTNDQIQAIYEKLPDKPSQVSWNNTRRGQSLSETSRSSDLQS